MNDATHPESQSALHQASLAFVAQRLRIAREAAGLSQKALASRIDMTPSAVSQLERGDIKPRAETVARIALALGIPPGFFGVPISGELLNEEACHFRSRRQTTKEEQRRVLARGNMLMLLAHYLESLVEFPKEVLSHLRNLMGSASDIRIVGGAHT